MPKRLFRTRLPTRVQQAWRLFIAVVSVSWDTGYWLHLSENVINYFGHQGQGRRTELEAATTRRKDQDNQVHWSTCL